MMPMMGFQSTMDRPEPVSRVTPPSTTMAKTSPQQTNNHKARERRAPTAAPEG